MSHQLKLVPTETYVPKSHIRSVVRAEIQKLMDNILAPAIGQVLGDLRTEMEAGFRDAMSEFTFKGNWSEGVTYRQGNFVSMGGQVYHCNFDNKDSRPGTDGGNWSLAVKSGRDGRDGKDAPPPERRTVQTGIRSEEFPRR